MLPEDRLQLWGEGRQPQRSAAGGKPCPNCGAQVANDAVICISCGWDARTNKKVRTKTSLRGVPRVIWRGVVWVVLLGSLAWAGSRWQQEITQVVEVLAALQSMKNGSDTTRPLPQNALSSQTATSTNQRAQPVKQQPGSSTSATITVQQAAQAAPPVPTTKPCATCSGTGGLKCRWCKEGQVDCPGPCLKLSRGKWQHMDVAGHDPKELWQKFDYGRGAYKAWSQGHVGEVVVMQNGEPVNTGPCETCNGTTHVPCKNCRGTGKAPCPACRGTGWVPRSPLDTAPAQR